jgi:tRNA-specific 2-thiouridylase
VEKDHEKNQLIIAQGHDHPSLYSTTLKAVDLHWIHSDSSNLPGTVTAKIRYRQDDQSCILNTEKQNSVFVHFEKPQFAVAPGQSIVFYDGEVCLGGGVIDG